MKVFIVSSQKGGTGKSTLTVNLAALECQNKHSKVAILDLDPQGSSLFWKSIRQSDDPKVIAVEPDSLLMTLSELEDEGYTHVWVDFPPVQKKWVRKSLQYADLVIIPTRASPFDLHSGSLTLEWAKEIGNKVVWVINGASASSKTAELVLNTLKKEAPVCHTIIHERNDFVLSIGLGLGVTEYAPKGKAAEELKQLHLEIQKLSK